MVTLGNKQTTLRSVNKSEFMVLEMCLSAHFHSDRESKGFSPTHQCAPVQTSKIPIAYC